MDVDGDVLWCWCGPSERPIECRWPRMVAEQRSTVTMTITLYTRSEGWRKCITRTRINKSKGGRKAWKEELEHDVVVLTEDGRRVRMRVEVRTASGCKDQPASIRWVQWGPEKGPGS